MVLLYDGSLEGFLTTVFYIHSRKISNPVISRENEYIPELFDQTLIIKSEKEEALRVLEGIRQKISKSVLNQITRAFLSEEKGAEEILHRFIMKGIGRGASIMEDLTDPDALGVMELSRRTLREYHRFLGLIRFRRLSTGEYYAPFEPETNLLPLLARHFTDRFNNQSWIIHDKKRKKALISYEGNIEMADLETLPEEASLEIDSAESKDPWVEIWKLYHRKIGIDERVNPRLQMQFMPKKYWQYLTEMG